MGKKIGDCRGFKMGFERGGIKCNGKEELCVTKVKGRGRS
jgi:hypothetical protein